MMLPLLACGYLLQFYREAGVLNRRTERLPNTVTIHGTAGVQSWGCAYYAEEKKKRIWLLKVGVCLLCERVHYTSKYGIYWIFRMPDILEAETLRNPIFVALLGNDSSKYKILQWSCFHSGACGERGYEIAKKMPKRISQRHSFRQLQCLIYPKSARFCWQSIRSV